MFCLADQKENMIRNRKGEGEGSMFFAFFEAIER